MCIPFHQLEILPLNPKAHTGRESSSCCHHVPMVSLPCLGNREARRPACREQRLGWQQMLVTPSPSSGFSAGGAWECPQQLYLVEKGMAGSGHTVQRWLVASPHPQCAPAKLDPAVAQESDINKRGPGAAGLMQETSDPEPESSAGRRFGRSHPASGVQVVAEEQFGGRGKDAARLGG